MGKAAHRPHVVIVGGGFAGLSAARGLRAAPVSVTLADRRNHHLFFPLLYQVATAGLNPSDVAAPIRHILRRQSNVSVLLAEARRVEPDSRRLVLDEGSLPYDFLILAAGSVASYFGHEGWRRFAAPLMSLEDALEIRGRILLAYERAEREPDPERRSAWLTFVVVGAGPTGVEVAGAIAEMGRHALARDFRAIDPRQTRVILVEGMERVLPPFPSDLSAKARRSLQRLGVEVRTATRVSSVDETGVWLGAERIESRCVVWAAGVAASPLAASLGVELDRMGRVPVGADLSVPGHPEIFVAGDLAAVRWGDRLVPGFAPAAMQQGRHTARAVMARLRGEPAPVFSYQDRGTLATIGRSAAVADFGRVRLSGFVAWAAWLLIHIYYLIGFRNRLLVLIQWAWAYVTYERGARLLTGQASVRPGGTG